MKKTVSKLKKELDKWFSLYIRLREANEYGMCQCFTCGIVRHYKEGMQNGHFQSRKHLTTRWDLKNCQVQCSGCNVFKCGEQFIFGQKLDAKYGEGTAEKLYIKAKQTVKLSTNDLQMLIKYYTDLTN